LIESEKATTIEANNMAECKYCYNLNWGARSDVRKDLKGLYRSADNGCPTCLLVKETIQGLLPGDIDPDTSYVLYTVNKKDRTDMLHPEDSSEWALNLRVEKESFEPEDDIVIYAVPGKYLYTVSMLMRRV
jgi:hypothetical protein